MRESAGLMTLVPNQPATPMHSFRCPHDLWRAAKAKAHADGTDLTTVLRAFLEDYTGLGQSADEPRT